MPHFFDGINAFRGSQGSANAGSTRRRSALIAHALGLAAVVAVTACWTSRLYPPAPAALAAEAPAPIRIPDDPAAGAVAAWIGPGQVRIDVAVMGLAIREGRAVALLRVNDEPPRPYVVGEQITRGTTLAAVHADGVTLERDGQRRRVAAPGQALDTTGLTRVR